MSETNNITFYLLLYLTQHISLADNIKRLIFLHATLSSALQIGISIVYIKCQRKISPCGTIETSKWRFN